MSDEIDNTQKFIQDLLSRMERNEPLAKDVSMSATGSIMNQIDAELDGDYLKEILTIVKVLPEWLRQFKGQTGLREWVEFIKGDFFEELAPLQELGEVIDAYYDRRLDRNADRVLRLLDRGLSEDAAIRIVFGTSEQIAKAFKSGADASARKKTQE